MKKLVLVLMLLVASSAIFAQGGLRVSLNQDLRHATLGDDKGNDAFNPAFLFRFDMQGNQQKWGYMVIGLEVEYTDLQVPQGFGYDDLEAEKWDFGKNDFKRYSVNVGYTFNELVVENLEATAMINYGITDRLGGAWRSFGLSGTLNYQLGDSNFSINAIGQLTNRKEKLAFYGDDANFTINGLNLDFSGFVGIAYDIPLRPIRGGRRP